MKLKKNTRKFENFEMKHSVNAERSNNSITKQPDIVNR